MTAEDHRHHRPTPNDLGVRPFESYALVIDARSPREYAEDHVPGATNLPVVDNVEYAEVGTTHRHDPHAAYLIGVAQSLKNMSAHIASVISPLPRDGSILVYCFRGGKRSKLWADTLRTIGFDVSVIQGGWKRYRGWVRDSLSTLPRQFTFKVLAGSTGSGKTRLLRALAECGEQTLDLEDLARHRGSLIGALPGVEQPSQKMFDSLLLQALLVLDPSRPVWVEAESKKIGDVQLPDALHESMRDRAPVTVRAPMSARVQLWIEDYPHHAADPVAMVEKLSPLKPLIGGEELKLWQRHAAEGQVSELFERVMRKHYDPAYARSTARSFGKLDATPILDLPSLDSETLRVVAASLIGADGPQRNIS